MRLLHDLRLAFEASVILAATAFSIWMLREGIPIVLEWARGGVEFVPVWRLAREWWAEKKKGSDLSPTPEKTETSD